MPSSHAWWLEGRKGPDPRGSPACFCVICLILGCLVRSQLNIEHTLTEAGNSASASGALGLLYPTSSLQDPPEKQWWRLRALQSQAGGWWEHERRNLKTESPCSSPAHWKGCFSDLLSLYFLYPTLPTPVLTAASRPWDLLAPHSRVGQGVFGFSAFLQGEPMGLSAPTSSDPKLSRVGSSFALGPGEGLSYPLLGLRATRS